MYCLPPPVARYSGSANVALPLMGELALRVDGHAKTRHPQLAALAGRPDEHQGGV